MTGKIIKDFRNELLKRRELEVEISADKNPGFAESGKMMTKQLKAEEERVVIKVVRSHFGKSEFLLNVFVYDSKEDKERIEPKKKEKKKVGSEEAQAGGKK